MGLSGAASLISLSGCSRVALSSVYVGSFIVLGLCLLMVSSLVVSPLQLVYWQSQLPPCLYAVVQVLVNKAVLADNQTYASKETLLPHQQYQPQLGKD